MEPCACDGQLFDSDHSANLATYRQHFLTSVQWSFTDGWRFLLVIFKFPWMCRAEKPHTYYAKRSSKFLVIQLQEIQDSRLRDFRCYEAAWETRKTQAFLAALMQKFARAGFPHTEASYGVKFFASTRYCLQGSIVYSLLLPRNQQAISSFRESVSHWAMQTGGG